MIKVLHILLFSLVTLLVNASQSMSATFDLPPEVLGEVRDKKSILVDTLTDKTLIFDQIYKVKDLTITDGVEITIDEIGKNKWIAIVVEKLNFEGKAKFKFTERYLDPNDEENIHGLPAKRGKNGKSIYDKSGIKGGDGGSGMPGGNGKSLSMPTVFLIVRELQFQGQPPTDADMQNINFMFNGLDGGNGGRGGDGGRGGRGAQGSDSDGNGLWCKAGPGRGGNGGRGGNAGHGGYGAMVQMLQM